MRTLFFISLLSLLFASYSFAQDPMPVLSASWQRIILKSPKVSSEATGPSRAVTNDDKYFQRKAREQRTDSPNDPNVMTDDARRAALEKAVQESRTPNNADLSGYSYSANVRNDSGKTVTVVFWEYRFVELARPSNVVRRQFLCSVRLKSGESKELSAFSTFAPSEVIDAESLVKPTEKLFDENVIVNRIEFSDGTLRQRSNWKYEDVQKAVERLTSAPWTNDACRAL